MSSKCPRCGKSVYANERVRAVNKEFHKGIAFSFTPTFLSSLFAQCSFVFFCAAACFKCMTCNVSLQLGAECGGPDGSLQCKKCYQQKFGPKGFGHGAAIAQGSQVQHDSPTHSVAAEPTAVECMLQKEAQQSASPSPSPSQAAPQAATTGSKFCSECGKAKDPSAKFCESFLIFNSLCPFHLLMFCVVVSPSHFNNKAPNAVRSAVKTRAPPIRKSHEPLNKRGGCPLSLIFKTNNNKPHHPSR